MPTLDEYLAEHPDAAPKRRYKRAEDALQVRCNTWLKTALPPEVAWTGIEHAQKLTAWQGQMRKAKGIRAGIEDLQFLYAGHFTAIELKVKSPQTEEQARRQRLVTAQRGSYFICRSMAEVEAALRSVGIPVRINAPPELIVSRIKAPRKTKPREPRASSRALRVGRLFHTP